MKRILKLSLLVAVAVGLLAASPSPASADSGVAVFTGTAATSPLTVIPGEHGATGTWSINVPSCTASSLPGCNIIANGTLAGIPGIAPVTPGPACGSSSGKSNPATSSFGTHTGLNISWQASAGSIIVLSGTADGGHTVVALVQTSPSPTPTGSLACIGAGATAFDVRGVGAVIG